MAQHIPSQSSHSLGDELGVSHPDIAAVHEQGWGLPWASPHSPGQGLPFPPIPSLHEFQSIKFKGIFFACIFVLLYLSQLTVQEPPPGAGMCQRVQGWVLAIFWGCLGM